MHARTGVRLLLLPLLLALAAPACAATHWSFGLGAGWRTFDSDFGTNYHSDPTLRPRDAVEYGGRASATWEHGFGLELAGGWSPTELQQDGRDVAKLHASFFTLNLVMDPMPQHAWGAPYLGAGGGAGIYYATDPEPGFAPPWMVDDEDVQYPGYLDLSGGWSFRLGGPVHLRLEARHLRWIGKNQGPFESSTPGSWTFGALVSVRSGGRPADADEDGIADESDRCPATPVGARVDRTGCPIDTDGDGVFDGLDFCPQTPAGARVDERGCGTDTDRDGVVDGIDRCDNTNRRCEVNADGCPIDTDGDGVCDAIDRCSATPKGWTVNDEGCPIDSDRDGVPDGGDQCPGTVPGAKVDGNGCPSELMPMERELATNGKVRVPVRFDPGRDLLLLEHESALEALALMLARWPKLKFQLAAYPSRAEGGGAALGEKRARAIRDDVVRRLPAADGTRLTVRGYPSGSSSPARVELVALDRTALRREAERRGLIKPPPPPAKKPATSTTPKTQPKSTSSKPRR